MRGMDLLIAQREAKRLPSLVMVDLDAAPLAFVRAAMPHSRPEWNEQDPPRQVPQVFVDPKESISRLDLRPLIGLRVFAFGHDGKRIAAFRDAALRHEAASVITYDYTTGEFLTHGEPTA